jgi:hypothetical protein
MEMKQQDYILVCPRVSLDTQLGDNIHHSRYELLCQLIPHMHPWIMKRIAEKLGFMNARAVEVCTKTGILSCTGLKIWPFV